MSFTWLCAAQACQPRQTTVNKAEMQCICVSAAQTCNSGHKTGGQRQHTAAAYLRFALHKLVQEGGEGEVSEGVPIIAHKGAGQQGAGKGRHTGVYMAPQGCQLPPARLVPPTELRLPKNTSPR